MLIFGPGIWHYLEYLFFILGLVLQTVLIATGRISLRRSIPWYAGWIIIPIITFGTYLMIGRALFLRDVPARESPTPGMDEVRFIDDGREYYDSMFQDIRGARRSICVECYIIRLDHLADDFIGLLCEKARDGVEVRVMFDDYGYDGRDFRILRRLRSAGARCEVFHNMTRCMFTPRKNYRNHRKTIAVDGEVAYMGGFNIGREYLGEGRFGRWADAAVRIRGPQVKDIMESFADMWRYCCGEDISADPHLFPETVPAGDTKITVVDGNPIRLGRNPVRDMMIDLISGSRESIFIETPYLIPDREMMDALCDRLEEGVEVTMIIPETQDHVGVYWGNRHYASILMRKGARVFCLDTGFLHGKVMLCDGSRGFVGTANLDRRSVELNFECCIGFDSERLGLEVRDSMERLLPDCTEYTLTAHSSRTSTEKIRSALSVLLSSQL